VTQRFKIFKVREKVLVPSPEVPSSSSTTRVEKEPKNPFLGNPEQV
jgi:hypothetical protein